VLRLGALWIVNPGSVTGVRARDSLTCAMLDLPGCAARFYDLDDGGEREVTPVLLDATHERPDG
jgi:predicted phosphodiesterase